MTGPGRRPTCGDHAARGRIARLVAVVAVLAGLVWLHSPPCADGMSATAAMTHSATADSAMDTSDCALPGRASKSMAAVGAAVTDASTGQHPGVPGGALAACVAFLVAVLAALVALLRPGKALVSTVPRGAARAGLVHTRLARAPRLSELCVLRT